MRLTLFVLNLCLDVIDGVAGLDVQGDGFASQSLHKDLHTSAEAKNKMKSGLFLDVIIRQSTESGQHESESRMRYEK